jgi:hypothetical protein
MTTVYDADEILVGGATDVFVAPVGTTFPTTISTPADNFPGFMHLGYTTEDGVRPSLTRNVNDIRSAQSFYPVRRVVASLDILVEFDLQQWNSETLLLALGGGTVTEPTNNIFRFTPAAESFIDERALLLRTVDGDKVYLWGFTRTQNSKNFQSSLVRTDAAVLPIGMTVLDPGVSDAFFMITNDPAFVLAS